MDAHDIAFADNSFDYLLSIYVLTVVLDLGNSVRDIFRVTRPGGWAVTLDHNLPELLQQNGAKNRIVATSLL